jgi:hypothetical protein
MPRRRTDKQPSRPLRAIMDVLVVLAALVCARLVIAFFGVLAASGIGSWYLTLTGALVPPIAGTWILRSPYGGVFSMDAAILVVLLLLAEWLVAMLGSRSTERTGGRVAQ